LPLALLGRPGGRLLAAGLGALGRLGTGGARGGRLGPQRHRVGVVGRQLAGRQAQQFVHVLKLAGVEETDPGQGGHGVHQGGQILALGGPQGRDRAQVGLVFAPVPDHPGLQDVVLDHPDHRPLSLAN
jgi:hypothetical protein